MIIEIPVGKSTYRIACEDHEKEKVFRFAARLNQRVNELSLDLSNSDEKTLLVIAALMIEEELDRVERGFLNDEENYEEQKLNEQDLYDAVSENMENVADYVEKLTKKMQNY